MPCQQSRGLLQRHDPRRRLLNNLRNGEQGRGVHVIVFAHDGVRVGEKFAGEGEVADIDFEAWGGEGGEAAEIVRPLSVQGRVWAV